jgi:5'-nucleotidase
MRILLTNDDGIDSVFLHELMAALSAAGHTLVVVAPQREQSWVGAGKSRHRPVACEATDRGFGCPTWIVDGTPADCVNIAFAHLLPTLVDRPEFSSSDASPDLIDGVVSGINIGLNASLGFILASGTIAGAWEGALHGLPAVAFSQDMSTALYDRLRANNFRPDPALYSILKISARHAAEMTPQLLNATPLRSFIVHNVNFPVSIRPDSETRRTVPARVIVPGLFGPAADDGTHRFVFTHGDDLSAPQPLTDRNAIAEGFISHTVLDYRKLGAG